MQAFKESVVATFTLVLTILEKFLQLDKTE
jgi:hypothetical protein